MIGDRPILVAMVSTENLHDDEDDDPEDGPGDNDNGNDNEDRRRDREDGTGHS